MPEVLLQGFEPGHMSELVSLHADVGEISLRQRFQLGPERAVAFQPGAALEDLANLEKIGH